MALDIRAATAADAPGIAAAEVASWRAAYARLMPADYLAAMDEAAQTEVWRGDVAKHAALRRKRLGVAIVEGAVAGFVRVGPPVEGEPVGLIYLLYVRPEHWGKGCGKALMDWGLGQLSAMGMSEAILWVLEGNARARAFYEASGWRAEGETSVETFGAARLASLRYRRALP